MLVYRSHRDRLDPATRLRRLLARVARCAEHGTLRHDEAVELLIDVGALEAGVADALSPEADHAEPPLGALRQASAATGAVLHACWTRDPTRLASALARTRDALARVAERALPTTIEVGVPEGYAYYALQPESYCEAAEDFLRAEAPAGAVCLGLRSIGTGLASAVEAALAAREVPTESYSLRPRGHPWDRRVALAPALAERIGGRAAAGWHVLVVDEGPGLSGSSFAGAAQALAELGVPEERIVLFPSWRTDGSGLRSETARERWPRHRQYVVPFHELVRRRREPLHPTIGGPLRDLSGGCWRTLFVRDASRWPAVQPQHERVKLLAMAPAPTLLKFAGLGRWGRAAGARAAQLAEAGFGPPVHGLANGFLAQGVVRGRPLDPERLGAAEFACIGDYLAHLATHHPGTRTVGVDELREMACVNVEEGLGKRWRGRLERAPAFREPHLGPAVAIDGRMQPHEWVRTGTGLVKLDGVDHHADHFLPGDQDIAWDVVGAGVELGLDAEARGALVALVADRARERDLARRLPFHALAYLAFRLGYTTLARETLGESEDGRRFARGAARYAGLLRRELEAGPQGTWAV
ncbi:MAG TPA: hypothetical protein VFS40_06450 [Gemmatimonadales bacterium]|nr:hypothetical protein [Gemmatimonadales bacterium]